MPHEARDNGNGEIVVIEKFKGTLSFVAELNTVDSHGSLAPSVGMRHLFLTRTNALQGVKCLLNSTRRGGPVWPCDASSALGVSAGPGEVDGGVRQTSLRLPLRSSFPGYPESPVVLPTVGLPRTSLTVFEAFGLSVFYHICGLDRFSFGCGIHAAPTCARAARSKPHSQDQVVPFSWVLSSLPSYLVLSLPYSSVYVCISETLLSALAS